MPVQLILGYFVFSLYTLAYQELQRQIAWRHASTSRVGARPAHQFLGPDEEQLTLSGVLLPEFAGSRLSLELLEAMAATGRRRRTRASDWTKPVASRPADLTRPMGERSPKVAEAMMWISLAGNSEP